MVGSLVGDVDLADELGTALGGCELVRTGLDFVHPEGAVRLQMQCVTEAAAPASVGPAGLGESPVMEPLLALLLGEAGRIRNVRQCRYQIGRWYALRGAAFPCRRAR